MVLKIDFYYWGVQCPLILSQLLLLEEYKNRLSVQTHNVSNNFETASRLRMFFPFLLVIDEHTRHFSPVRKEFLEQLADGKIQPEKPYRVALGREPYEAEIVPITKETILTAGQCTGRCNPRHSLDKVRFFEEYGLTTLGFVNTEKGRLLGGAEYAPSMVVPYDIPRSDDTAFITCVYLSSDKRDTKSPPLKHLERYLSVRYKKVIAVTDEIGVFPNGDLTFFTESGYMDHGVISEKAGLYRLHLVEKKLQPDN